MDNCFAYSYCGFIFSSFLYCFC